MNTLVDRTHDISRINYHVKDLATFGEILTSAAAAAFPDEIASRSQAGHGDERPRYQEIHVLLISWEDDNLGVVKEISELREVFQKTYCYSTKEFQIPSHKSHNALAKQILEFVDEPESKESLLIVYYGGHGYMNDDRQCIWSCTGEADSATVKWFGLQTMLEQAQSDILILLDCCAAASSTTSSGTGVIELIAACGFETWAPGVSEHSFTRSLIDELTYWAKGPTLTVALLHNKVLSRIKYWKPRFGRTGNYEHRKTPIYIVLANDGKQRSIELEPLRHQASSELEASVPPSGGPLSQWPSHSSAPSTKPSTDAGDNPSSSSQSSLSNVWPDPQYECPKVLVSLALEDDQILETEAWVEWLRSVPAVVQYAQVEGLYRSDSTLLLLSLPISIWDLLPKDPAVNFIGFVRSPDLLKAHNELKNSPISKPFTIQSQRKRTTCHQCQTLSVESATKCGNCGHLHCPQCLLEVPNPDSLAVSPIATDNKSLQRKLSDRLKAIAKEFRNPEVLYGPSDHFYDTNYSSPGLMYQTIQSIPPQHFTLKEAIRTCDRPHVAELYIFAYRISKELLQLHRRGWLHKNFSSDVVVFSDTHVESSGWDEGPRTTGTKLPEWNPPSALIYRRHPLYIVGIGDTNPRKRILGEFESVPYEVLRRMIHIHPDRKIKNYKKLGRPMYDYYSLGMVLVELGLWKQLGFLDLDIASMDESTEAPERWLRKYVPQLGEFMGPTYVEIVAWCLGVATENEINPKYDEVEDFEETVVYRMKYDLLYYTDQG
ncbi:hypothetical protein N7G274_000585 [Stereocaulon virgatum]|uniref:Peptidase C14 caspase domain-containing protein n=1 Tax=Stereocaulon virgatum TaxID=373712 RepID=A0ABR4ASK7_9LECA